MSDTGLRELERLARSGDADALLRLQEAERREGKVYLPAWPHLWVSGMLELSLNPSYEFEVGEGDTLFRGSVGGSLWRPYAWWLRSKFTLVSVQRSADRLRTIKPLKGKPSDG